MFPDILVLLPTTLILSARILRKDVFPAPEDPMIKVACPGAAYPETDFTIAYLLVLPIVGFVLRSRSVVGTSTSKKTFSQLNFIGCLQSILACSTISAGSISGLLARDIALMPGT